MPVHVLPTKTVMPHFACQALCVPYWIGVTFVTVFMTTFCMSVLLGHVTPYLPYISETGSTLPERSIFTLGLCIASFLAGLCIWIRYRLVDQLTFSLPPRLHWVNLSSVFIGWFACGGLLMVASFPESLGNRSLHTVHMTSAGICFYLGFVYMLMQTGITYYVNKALELPQKYFYLRVLLCLITSTAAVLLTTGRILGETEWNAAKSHLHGIIKRNPEDPGFWMMFMGAVGEWSIGISFVSYFLTYIPDFRTLYLETTLLIANRGNEESSQLVNNTTPNERLMSYT